MRRLCLYAAIASVLICTAASPLFALRANDFTKANKAFERRYDSDKAPMADKRSQWADSQKMTKSQFVTPHDADYLKGQKAYLPDNTNADSLSQSRDYRNKKSFDNVPEYSGKTKKDEWYKSQNQTHFDNSDRNLSKQYLGKIDTTKRDLYDQNYLRDHYQEMMDMSLQDINKFYYREGRNSEGIPTQVAGGERNSEDDGSVFDFLSKDKRIERPAVALRGPKSSSQPRPDAESEAKPASAPNNPAASAPVLKSAGELSANPPSGAKLMKPLVRGESKSSGAPKKKVTSYETIDKDIGFMNLPENMRGETTIKVEVQEAEF